MSITIPRRIKLQYTVIIIVFLTTIFVLSTYTGMTPRFSGYDLPERIKSFIGRTAFQEVSVLENVSQKEVHHVVFAKVHKAASTTVMNILYRFGLSRNLTFMLPRIGNIINNYQSVSKHDIIQSLQNGTYDILCNHVVFNKTVISKYFPSDTKYIAILRNPFNHIISAILYFTDYFEYLRKIDSKTPISTYLADPMKYEPKYPIKSFTNNRMSLDLGYDPKELSHESKTRALQFIKQLEKDFHLVLITEHFVESLVLLRRLLGWKMKDIVYISSNVLKKKKLFRYSPEDSFRLQKWAWLDIAVYDHFYKVFWKKVFEQGPKFFHEVHAFQSIRRLVVGFCSQHVQKAGIFRVNQTEWNEEFEITRKDCSLMAMPELSFVNRMQMNHIQRLKEHAINFKMH